MTDENTKTGRSVADCVPTDFFDRAYDHYAKALRKHPRFADEFYHEYEGYCHTKDDALIFAQNDLKDLRDFMRVLADGSRIDVWTLLNCEFYEAFVEYMRDDKSACVDELYDAVAVQMRMIAVVEGKQRLGGEV